MSIWHGLVPILFYSILLLVQYSASDEINSSEGGLIDFTVYEDANEACVQTGGGTCERFRFSDVTDCVNFNFYHDKISSINTHGTCVRIWEHRSCEGESMVITPEVSCRRNLEECAMQNDVNGSRTWDNQISSLNACNRSKSNSIMTTSEQCPNQTWLNEIRVRPGVRYGLELDCLAPGDLLLNKTIYTAENVRMGRHTVTHCPGAMRGVGFTFSDEDRFLPRGFCRYEDHVHYPAGSLCAGPATAVCGISFSKDEMWTAMQPNVTCCSVPNPASTCVPTERFQLINQCGSQLDCKIMVGVGIGKSSSGEMSRAAVFYSNFYKGFGVLNSTISIAGVSVSSLASQSGTEDISAELSSNFGQNIGESNGTALRYNWNWNATEDPEIWKQEKLYNISFSMETWASGQPVLEQLVGSCGFIEVYTNYLRRTDFDKDGAAVVSFVRFTIPKEPDTGVGLLWLVAVVILIICAGAVGLGLVIYLKRNRRLHKEELEMKSSTPSSDRDKVSDRDVKSFVFGYTDVANLGTTYEGYVRAQQFPYNASKYEIPADELEIDRLRVLGKGAYGIVYQGTYKGDPESGPRQVAIKMIQPGADADIGRALLAELKVMIYLGKNSHTAELVGSCTGKFSYEELCIVLPLYSNGSLDIYLRENRKSFQNELLNGKLPVSMSERRKDNKANNKFNKTILIKWAHEIAEGMHCLTTKKVIHGDLSTRNLLLDDNLTVKITDFGLSRRLYECTLYLKTNQAPLPWRWMPMEALCDMTFSVQSDVWSYGITLWELFSLAQVPYPGLVYGLEFVNMITEGYRMPAPKYAAPEIYELMQICWQFEPELRPSFEELCRKLDGILKSVSKNVQYV